MLYISANEAAKKWNISARRVQQMCKSGEIPGAVKEGRSWVLPENVPQPVRKTLKASRPLLPLPVGISSYVEAVSNYYYKEVINFIRNLFPGHLRTTLTWHMVSLPAFSVWQRKAFSAA